MFCENDAAFDFGAIEDGNGLYFVGHFLVFLGGVGFGGCGLYFPKWVSFYYGLSEV
jgi:hypothetical protein